MLQLGQHATDRNAANQYAAGDGRHGDGLAGQVALAVKDERIGVGHDMAVEATSGARIHRSH